MTRQDYIRIGDAIKGAEDHPYGSVELDVQRRIVANLCAVFKADNPRFDEARFRAYVEAS